MEEDDDARFEDRPMQIQASKKASSQASDSK